MDTTELSPELALTGAIFATAGAAFAPVTVMFVRRLVPGRQVFFARWGFSHVAMALGLAFLASIVIVVSAQQFTDDIESLDPVVLVSLGLVPQLVSCGAILWWAQRKDPLGVRCLGFRKGGHGRALAASIGAYVMSLPFLFGLMQLWPWLLTRLGETYAPQQMLDVVSSLHGAELAAVAFLIVVVAPLIEELLFRGFLQPLLVQNFRDKGGVVLTSLFFASLHDPGAFLPIFGFSLVLGFLMLRTQSLIAVWAVHALHNALTLTLALSVVPA